MYSCDLGTRAGSTWRSPILAACDRAMPVTSDVGSRLATPASPDSSPWPLTPGPLGLHPGADLGEALLRVHRPGRHGEPRRGERVAADRPVGAGADDEAGAQRASAGRRARRGSAMQPLTTPVTNQSLSEPPSALRRGQGVGRAGTTGPPGGGGASAARHSGEPPALDRPRSPPPSWSRTWRDGAQRRRRRRRGRAAGRRPTSPPRRAPAGRCRPGGGPVWVTVSTRAPTSDAAAARRRRRRPRRR